MWTFLTCLCAAYKVRVADFRADLSTDIYTMQVQEVIKQGGFVLLFFLQIKF